MGQAETVPHKYFFLVTDRCPCADAETAKLRKRYERGRLHGQPAECFDRHLRRCVPCAVEVMNRQAIRQAAQHARVSAESLSGTPAEAARKLGMTFVEIPMTVDWVSRLIEEEKQRS